MSGDGGRLGSPTALFFCGLPCSGKTFWARRLEVALPGRRYSVDEQVLDRYDVTLFDERLGALAREARGESRERALLDLSHGHHVLLDWSSWSRRRRAEWAARAETAGYAHRILHLDVPLDLLKKRLRRRNAALPTHAQLIPLEELERFAKIFEPPSDDEELSVLSVGPTETVDAVLQALNPSR